MGSTESLFCKSQTFLGFSIQNGVGNLPEQHVGLDYKTLNEGYFESGIELNQIFKSWVFTALDGPNQLSR
jgi:hypothetical protein